MPVTIAPIAVTRMLVQPAHGFVLARIHSLEDVGDVVDGGIEQLDPIVA